MDATQKSLACLSIGCAVLAGFWIVWMGSELRPFTLWGDFIRLYFLVCLALWLGPPALLALIGCWLWPANKARSANRRKWLTRIYVLCWLLYAIWFISLAKVFADTWVESLLDLEFDLADLALVLGPGLFLGVVGLFYWAAIKDRHDTQNGIARETENPIE
jgi:hypothetical protein